MKRILVIFSHPALQSSRANKQLLQAIDGLEGVTLHDLYQHYPNMFINVKREQACCLNTTSSCSSTPLLVLLPCHHEGVDGSGTGVWLRLRPGSPRPQRQAVAVGHHHRWRPESYCSEGYNQRPLLDFLLPFRQTAQLCGMSWLPPFVLHSFHKIRDQEALRRCGQDYRQLLCALRDEQLTPAQLAGSPYLRDLLEVLS